MIPVVTPSEMAAVDAAAPEPVEVLVDRAARAVARIAVQMLGGTYGRRVTVLAGPGNNGADGRVAARHLERRGIRCRVVDAVDPPATLPAADLVIDAAFGTGLARPYDPPALPAGARVLAVDIPSGVDGLSGQLRGSPWAAERTVTFAALKPGLVLEPGRSLAGEVTVVDIGLDVGEVRVHAVTDADMAPLVPRRDPDAHKWRAGLRIVGGSPGMTGAASLAARAALRTGAGIVELCMPGGSGSEGPTEAVGRPLPRHDWATEAAKGLDGRVRAMLVGPGLGRDEPASVVTLLGVGIPLVLDGDALVPEIVDALRERPQPTVLTPHDGEWARLGGSDDADRIGATASFAGTLGVTVIRKGSTSIVADPTGEARVVTSGSAALASAGTGDVLAGMTVALLARGLPAFDAATVAAHVHGRAGRELGEGLLAGELVDAIGPTLAAVRERR